MARRITRFIERTVYRSVDYGRGNLRIAGIFGALLFPVYWVVWRYLSPEPYENLILRLVGSVLCVPLLFEERCLASFPRLFPFYWYLVLIYALPFFFTYMLLMNGADVVWGMSLLCAVVVLALVVADWLNFAAICAIGGSAAVLAAALAGPLRPLSGNLPALLFVLFFLAVATNVLNFNWRNVERNRNLAIQAWSNSAIHEVQTPLASILMATRGLRKHVTGRYDDEHLLFFIEEAERVCKNGLTTVRMMLLNTAYRPEDRRDYAETDVRECIEQAVNGFPYESEADRRRVSWRAEADFKFSGSPELLVHVLFNLIKNALVAIKGSRMSDAVVEIWTGEDHRGGTVTVRDSGPGIAAKDIPRIFERYFSTSRDFQGTGNGLAFCKAVMEGMGGSIRCQSQLGSYTEFTLSFPRLAASADTS